MSQPGRQGLQMMAVAAGTLALAVGTGLLVGLSLRQWLVLGLGSGLVLWGGRCS